MRRRVPNPILIPLIEWRARRIGDPVERLRFLKRRAEVRLPRPGRGVRRTGACLGVLAALIVIPAYNFSGSEEEQRGAPSLPPRFSASVVPDRVPDVWLVEQNEDFEIYSNGLRIENRFLVAGEPRSYGLIDRRRPDLGFGEWRSEPAGIVYHTTESEIVPFQSEQNRALKQMGTSLLEYVRREHSYNFVVDRFGRVFRIVAEGDVANHAGYSVWADPRWLYLNLNASFIGVSFEAQSARGTEASVSPAQIHAARVLTEMLRHRYRIAAVDCVTHAQVSVNPDNMRIGYHTDWAGDFPFGDLGLADNYGYPLPSLYAFGFTYDPAFVRSTGARLWLGVALAEQEFRQAAAAAGLGPREYRAALQQRYRKNLMALKATGAPQEKSNESN